MAKKKAVPLPGTDKLPKHALKYLTSRAVSQQVALDAGIRYLTSSERRELVGAQQREGGEDDSDGLYIPFPRYLKKFTVRALAADVKQPKFKSQKGVAVPPYWATCNDIDWSQIIHDTTVEFSICEGPVKALALTSHGFLTVAINGCQGWLRNRELIDELREVDWSDRRVVLTPDNDVHSNMNVSDGWGGLAEVLQERGANVFYRLLPYEEGGPKVGPDDYLKEHGRKGYAALECAPCDDERFAAWGVPPEIATLNQRHAFLKDSQTPCVYVDAWDDKSKPPRYALQPLLGFKAQYANEFVTMVNAKGDPVQKPLGDYWLSHRKRRSISEIVFDPNKPWGLNGDGTANLWPGFGYEPVPPTASRNWWLLKNHIRDNICNGNMEHFKYVMGWMAFGVQRLTTPAQVAIVLTGGEGTGKGTFGRSYIKLFGAAGIHIQQGKDLIGNFNGHQATKVAFFADEAIFAGDHRIANALKGLITEDTRLIEAKFREPISIPNYTRLIIASNESHVIQAGSDSRRFAVFRVLDEHKQDSTYFSAIDAQMKNGGYESMLYELMQYDLSDFNVYDIPRTEELGRQREESMPIEERWWLHCLRERTQTPSTLNKDTTRGWEERVETSRLRESLAYFSRGERRENDVTSRVDGRLRAVFSKYGGAGLIVPCRYRSVVGAAQAARGWRFAPYEKCVESFKLATGGIIDTDMGEIENVIPLAISAQSKRSR